MRKKLETEFQTGELCLYEEDGCQLKCEIVDRALKEDGKVLSLGLRVIEVIGAGAFGAIEKGKVFDVWKRLDCFTPAFWEIKEFTQRNLSQLS